MTRLVACAAAAAAITAVSAPVASAARAERVLVSAASARSLPAGSRLVAAMAPGLRAYSLPVPRGTSAAAYADRLGRRSGIFAAQVDARLHANGIASSCAENPPTPEAGLIVANTVNASAVVSPRTTAPIAILDTGVDPATPELAGRVLAGFNATDASTNTADLDAHGTEVAAVAAAKPGRFRGISVTSPILPITIYTPNADTTVDWVVRGIQEAVNRGAKVINISSSNPLDPSTKADAPVLDQAITAAFAKGTITVVAAGNEGKINPTVPGSLTRVLTVGSVSTDGTLRDSFSNFGPWIDVVSPSAGLVLPAPSAICSSGYGSAQGTSFSAPAVAGAAAIVQATKPTLNAQGLYDVMRFDAVKDLSGTTRNDDYGFGMLNVASGVGAGDPIKQPTEVDDDVFWLKADPGTHPTLLKSGKSAQVKSSVESGKDPQDVFPVRLLAGERLTASASAKPTSDLLDMTIWKPSTGSFDVGKGVSKSQLADSNGVTNAPQASYRAPRTGTYYVSIEAPDVPDPTDPFTADLTLQTLTSYTLTLKKVKTAAKKKAKKKRKKK